ncbi:MAG: hypothetical protein ABI369_14375 [Acetobacteraceae bacterium]
MRTILILAAIGLLSAPMAALAQTAPSADVPPGHGQQAGQAFGNAGESAADAARSAWQGLKHGWTATKEHARAGWNAATQEGDPAPADPHPAR